MLASTLLVVTALWTASCTDEQKSAPSADAVTPVEEWTSSFAGQEAGELRVMEINGVSYRFRWQPPGTFAMGASESEQEYLLRVRQERTNTSFDKRIKQGMELTDPDRATALERGREWIVAEGRRHDVTLTQGFWMLETEVTQPMWESIMGNNPSKFQGANLPVESVSWNDCQRFLTKLNKLGIAPVGSRFALPTEAQWEYACRAGTATPFFWGDSLNGDRANCNGRDPYGTDAKGKFIKKTVPVGSYVANPWGLLDMHGNVAEWCQDRCTVPSHVYMPPSDYPTDAVTDPRGPNAGCDRIARGGSWQDSAEFCRSAYRGSCWGPSRLNFIGFRFALVPVTEEMLQEEKVPAQADATPAEEWTVSFDGKKAGDLRVVDVDGVSYSFRWSPPGSFTMGSSEREQEEVISFCRKIIDELEERDKDAYASFFKGAIEAFMLRLPNRETRHDVTLTHGFWTLETEVTQLMWKSIMEYNPSAFEGVNLPVENVSWNECQEFVAKLNDLGYAPVGSRFALPNEAQWEYACRAGTTTAFFWGDSFTGVEANCPEGAPSRADEKVGPLRRTTPVGSYAANPWGLVDMHGNVAEWCEDSVIEIEDFSGENVRLRTIRGGYKFPLLSVCCRSASRDDFLPTTWSEGLGFRVVLVPLSE
jgi:formylglycine-generating enzyme required for sulfatase activity